MPYFNYNYINNNSYPFHIIELNTYQIDATGGNGNYSYSIQDINKNKYLEINENGVFEITDSSDYRITITDGNGCSYYEDYVISKIEIFIPNVFSPNGDNPNTNTWYPENLELEGVSFLEFQNMEVTIFDRYGRLLKSYYGPLNRKNGEGWDGTYQGTKLPTGDYWYKVKLNNKEGSVLVGNFTLYRK